MNGERRLEQEPPGTGTLGTIAALAGIQDGAAAADGFREAMRSAYWDDRDLQAVMAIAYAAAGRLLSAAAADPESAGEARSYAKAMMYDLASFTWPGWDEPGVTIGPSEAGAGMAAARANLAMAIELEKGDLPTGRAHWMLGAHLLSGGEHAAAAGEFDRAARHSRRAGAEAEADLAAAFRTLAELAGGDPEAAPRLDAALQELGATDEGEAFVGQVETAKRVLGL
jgi:hypothetical protein